MSGPQNLNDLKAKVSALKTEVDAITQTEWENYVKIRDILAQADELVLGSKTPARIKP